MPSRKTTASNPLNEAKAKNAESKKPLLHMLNVSELCPHPRQMELVGDMSAVEFEALVADIEANGIQNPLIVMANRQTIICGHQRHRAAVRLRLEKVPCIVRTDLHDPEEPAAMKLLLYDNLRRRQLGPLEKAKYTKELFEIELGHRLEPDNSWDWHNKIAVRDSVGRILGCSGRNAARYLAVVSAPQAVQEAFAAGMLPLALAASVAFLRPDAREKLAVAVRKLLDRANGKGAKQVKQQINSLVKAALSKTRRPKPVVIRSPIRLLRNVNDCLDANLREANEKYSTIVSDLREDDDGSGLASESADILRNMRYQVVRDLRERADRLSQLVVQLEESLALHLPAPGEQVA